MFIINTNYKTTENSYEIQDNIVLISMLKKNGSKAIAKIDLDDLDKIKSCGIWFAEWNKELNSYIAESISKTKTNKKKKPLKQSLQSFILGVNPKAPIKHLNGDTLDNRKSNLQIVDRNLKNEYEVSDDNTVIIFLKDKYGNIHDKALISLEDLEMVINDTYSWVLHKTHKETAVVANTPNGRIYLDKLIMKPDENKKIHHINLNPLDNRRKNLELKDIE